MVFKQLFTFLKRAFPLRLLLASLNITILLLDKYFYVSQKLKMEGLKIQLPSIPTVFLQGILKGEVSLYRWPPVWLFGISCMTTDNFCFHFQNRLIQTSQTGGQWYSDTSPLSIPWFSIEQVKLGCMCMYAFCILTQCLNLLYIY